MPKLQPLGATSGMTGPGMPLIHPLPSAAPTPLSVDTAGALTDIDLSNVPSELKTEGTDWFVIFNPKVKRVLDVNLVHTLMHESVVCCVRFSADGKYVVTGCHRRPKFSISRLVSRPAPISVYCVSLGVLNPFYQCSRRRMH
ncbi:hypothetical protein CPB85DRAFT_124837 [Mucidula mucida]|nr:hypothetical protein CPB85DRAFT_124837 [Mucidula mucida]